MRFILGIDTASRFGSIALARDGRAEAWEALLPGEHSSGLSIAAARLLGDRALTIADLAGVAVAAGPGSFTGLRIGLAWAKGVCSAIPTRMAVVSNHEASAHLHRHAGPLLATVLPGERGEAQVALWSGGEEASLLFGPEGTPEGALVDVLLGAAGNSGRGAGKVAVPPGGIMAAGAGLTPAVREVLSTRGIRILESGDGARAGGPDPISPPLAAAVAELGDRDLRAGREVNVAAATPSYGRAPNARRPGA